MMKRMLAIATGGLLLLTFVFGAAWAGQVVTDSHRNWAKVMLAQEKSLGETVSPGTLAVLYFINHTGRVELDPAQKGLAYMLITDLSQVEGFQLVERVKLQALVQELGLGVSGLADPETAPRVGRLLRAAQVVGGGFSKLEWGKFAIDPAVLETAGEAITALPAVAGAFADFIRMEKEVLFEILAHLGKVPTDEKTLETLRKPMTTSDEALFFMFKGLQESDRRNYAQAGKYYKRSLKADPGFTAAGALLHELALLKLIGKKRPARSFLQSLRDRTSLTDRLSPDQAVRRVRTPTDIEKRQSLLPLKPDDVDDDKDGFTENEGDCNDADSSVYPGAVEICGDGIDQDCNGKDALCPEDIDKDGDGYTERQGDCNDNNADIHPGATEICGDGIDQDCSGLDDTCKTDKDDDADGVTENEGDCNDADSSVYPGAVEICGDGIDQDCDGKDTLCPEDIDDDGDGYTENQGDCDDNNADIHPGAEEVCGDGIDQDCSGLDDICETDKDDDGDGITENEGDCNDADASIHPGAAEICGDGIDQDCDGNDSLCPDDIDDDGDGYTENQGDCNDDDKRIHPGAEEICGDQIDQNCDGVDLPCPDLDDVDDDGDGYSEQQGDCNDNNKAINPGAAEICGDGIDQDCDGVDLECPDPPSDIDDDGDGYTENDGDCNDSDAGIHPGAEEICGDRIDQDCDGADLACTDPNDIDDDGDGYTENQGDCNDKDSGVNPGATEICGDRVDQDCDGIAPPCTDPKDSDDDGDGFTENQGDCDDSDVTIHPRAPEVCGDKIDNDCDGYIDEDCSDSDRG